MTMRKSRPLPPHAAQQRLQRGRRRLQTRPGSAALRARPQNAPVRLGGRNGMALVAVMTVLMFILAVMLVGVGAGVAPNPRGDSGLATTAGGVVMSGKARIQTIGAVNEAETGIRAALQWLNQQSYPPSSTRAFAPSNFWGGTQNDNWTTVNFDNGSFKVRIYPWSDNAIATQKKYLIESVGMSGGRVQTVRAAAIQQTFARYAFFTDNASDNWWVAGASRFNGPVHINASNGKNINILWKNSGVAANNRIFTYNIAGETAFTTSAPSINWNVNSVPNTQTPSSAGDWNNVATAGSTAVRTGVPPVEMPTQSSQQERVALGLDEADPIPPSGAVGVTVPSSGGATKGGVYISGDVDDMQLSTSGAGNVNQIATITQHDDASGKEIKTTVTMDPVLGTTTLKVEKRNIGATTWGGPTISNYAGATNGVVYCSGNIGGQGTDKTGGLSGTVADSVVVGGTVIKPSALSIVTAADKNLNIDGNITYKTTSGGVASTSTGTLGLVSKHVQIVDKDSAGASLSNVTVHATVMAYDTFDVTNPDTRPVGGFTLLGGYIAKDNGKFGQFDSANGSIVSGFTKTLNYDPRVASAPPPAFPSTGNQYMVASFQRVQSALQQ